MATTEILFKHHFTVALNGGAERMITVPIIYDGDGNEYLATPWQDEKRSFETIRRIPFKAIDEPDYTNDTGFLIEYHGNGGYQTDRKKYKLYVSMSNIETVVPKWSLQHSWSHVAYLFGGFGYGGVGFSRNVSIPEADKLWDEWNDLIWGERATCSADIRYALSHPELADWGAKKFDRLLEIKSEYAQLIERLESTPIDELVERYVR